MRASRLGKQLGLNGLYIKDRGAEPDPEFQSARHDCGRVDGQGAEALETRGAFGQVMQPGALAAYAARGGMEAHIFMPKDTPRANVIECEQTGANVTLMDGLITDCGAEVGRRKEAEGWFDVSTLKSHIASRARRRWAMNWLSAIRLGVTGRYRLPNRSGGAPD